MIFFGDVSFQKELAIVAPLELDNIREYLRDEIIDDYRHLLEPKEYSDEEYPDNWLQYKENVNEYIPIIFKMELNSYDYKNTILRFDSIYKLEMDIILKCEEPKKIFDDFVLKVYKNGYGDICSYGSFTEYFISMCRTYDFIRNYNFQKSIGDNCPEQLLNIMEYLDEKIKEEFEYILDSGELGII